MAGWGQRSAGGSSGAVRPGAISALLQEIAAAPAAAGLAWDSGLRPGAVVGRFELVRELGRGGFGVVWEAKDRELGRKVAFKAVRPGARRDLREERLLREAEAAARLSHPNIVTLFDVGRAEQGPYLVLELLEGETLAERLSRGPEPPAEAIRIAVEVAMRCCSRCCRGGRPFEGEKALRSPRPAPALEVPGEPALGALVARMLAKRPVDRPRDGAEVHSALAVPGREGEGSPAAARDERPTPSRTTITCWGSLARGCRPRLRVAGARLARAGSGRQLAQVRPAPAQDPERSALCRAAPEGEPPGRLTPRRPTIPYPASPARTASARSSFFS